jgi:DNA-directed RNA polymerase subunit M/transcription elongation factor TFIIS
MKQIERTCRQCGNRWILPRKLKRGGKAAALGAIMSGITAADAVLVSSYATLERCSKCGSVSHFSERTLSRRESEASLEGPDTIHEQPRHTARRLAVGTAKLGWSGAMIAGRKIREVRRRNHDPF